MSSETQILGLDLASRTGWAHSFGYGGVIDLRNKQKDWGRMAYKFQYELKELLQEQRTDAIVCELPPNQLMGAARMILLGLHWQVRCAAFEFSIPMHDVAVPTIKKWATGSGKATKEDMIKAATDLDWMQVVDDNHADAMLICKWGEENVTVDR